MTGSAPVVNVTFTLSPSDYADGFDCDPIALADSVRARLDEVYDGNAYPRFPRGVVVSITTVRDTATAARCGLPTHRDDVATDESQSPS